MQTDLGTSSEQHSLSQQRCAIYSNSARCEVPHKANEHQLYSGIKIERKNKLNHQRGVMTLVKLNLTVSLRISNQNHNFKKELITRCKVKKILPI